MSGPDVETSLESSLEAAALRVLGYGDPVAGPVQFGGVRFWAALNLDDAELIRRRNTAGHDREHAGSGGDRADYEAGGAGALTDPETLREHLAAGGSPAVRLRCCLVSELESAQGMRQASLLAGYSPRAVLVDATGEENVGGVVDVLGVAMHAALLDQGVVVRRAGGRLEVVATPGPRVDGHGLDLREALLRETVYAAWLTATGRDATAGRDENGLFGPAGARGTEWVKASR